MKSCNYWIILVFLVVVESRRRSRNKGPDPSIMELYDRSVHIAKNDYHRSQSYPPQTSYKPDNIRYTYKYNKPKHKKRKHSSPQPMVPMKINSLNEDEILKSSKKALYITRKDYLKADWCNSEPLVQKIKLDGCISKRILNKFCYGQCNSFYIPRNLKVSSDKSAFKSCAFCKPKKFSWTMITLRCPNSQPSTKKIKIQKIKHCRCRTEILQ